MSSSCRHTDFEKIHAAFLSHYRKDPKLGESRYADWLKFSGRVSKLPVEFQAVFLEDLETAVEHRLKVFESASFNWREIG